MTIVHGYCSVQDLKDRLSSSPTVGLAQMDPVLEDTITAISREIDQFTNRRFYAVSETRYFTARYMDVQYVPDLLSIDVNGLATDLDGSRTYTQMWATSDFDLEPYNAALESQPQPYTHISTTPLGLQFFPTGMRRGVRIAGSWGFSTTTPPLVREACILACARLLRRPDSPMGIAGSDAAGGVIRLAMTDPDVKRMLLPFKKWSVG